MYKTSSDFGKANSSIVFNLNNKNSYTNTINTFNTFQPTQFKIVSQNTFLVQTSLVRESYLVDPYQIVSPDSILRKQVVLAGPDQDNWYQIGTNNLQSFTISLYVLPTTTIPPNNIYLGTLEFN
jgi:hypothetical protein